MAEDSSATASPWTPNRCRNWCEEEIRALISVWTDDIIQAEFGGTHRNQHVYKKISAEQEKLGYRRTWDKCRDKVKTLKHDYKKVVDNNNETEGKGKL